MSDQETAQLTAADKQFLWHPFMDMPEWRAPENEPVVILEGRGAILRDSRGREYLDGNSSIWTNVHGHNHPRINDAIREQLERIAHCSFLGATHPSAIELAREIVALFPPQTLTRVFYSDDGSTAMEVALRVASQFFRMRGETERNTFIYFRHAYHGDTAGAAALGAATMFGGNGEQWRFPVQMVCSVEELLQLSPTHRDKTAAVVIEPLIQGAAGMRVWPRGTCATVREWCDRNGALLIADEVMTGFGRTGKMFAIEHEQVVPDIIALGKGLSGGYLPLAMTLTTEELFEEFNGSVSSGRALAYGHSYTANPLGCAAARASLGVFREEKVLEHLQPKISALTRLLRGVRDLPGVAQVRQCGFVAGIEVTDEATARQVCRCARGYGLLTRNVREVVVLMLPLCTTLQQLERAVAALCNAIAADRNPVPA